MEVKSVSPSEKTDIALKNTVKIGQNIYFIERHFTDERTISDAFYDILHMENKLSKHIENIE